MVNNRGYLSENVCDRTEKSAVIMRQVDLSICCGPDLSFVSAAASGGTFASPPGTS